VECPACGPKLEALDWLEPRSRVTRRMAEDVAKLCRVLPIKHVAERFGLDWHTVKAIDKAWLERTLPGLDVTKVNKLLLDEFAIHKGHRYATSITDADTLRVLWVGHGRGQEAVRPFFQAIGKEACARIKAVGMDMHAPFETEVRRHCVNAEIVYDLFHVVMKYGREVIDRVRVDEANRLRKDKAARKVIKGSKWLLLANRENLTGPSQRIRLKELLAANQALMIVYLLRDDLKRLWRYTREGWARRAWNDWLERAMESGVPALKTFARNLAKRIDGVFAHCRWDLHTSVLEGMNNKIKVMKRMAYGYRDDDYFFLKIRAAFPGVSR
jgi:transposase